MTNDEINDILESFEQVQQALLTLAERGITTGNDFEQAMQLAVFQCKWCEYASEPNNYLRAEHEPISKDVDGFEICNHCAEAAE